MVLCTPRAKTHVCVFGQYRKPVVGFAMEGCLDWAAEFIVGHRTDFMSGNPSGKDWLHNEYNIEPSRVFWGILAEFHNVPAL